VLFVWWVGGGVLVFVGVLLVVLGVFVGGFGLGGRGVGNGCPPQGQRRFRAHCEKPVEGGTHGKIAGWGTKAQRLTLMEKQESLFRQNLLTVWLPGAPWIPAVVGGGRGTT